VIPELPEKLDRKEFKALQDPRAIPVIPAQLVRRDRRAKQAQRVLKAIKAIREKLARRVFRVK
jgi:G3E family GTPase